MCGLAKGILELDGCKCTYSLCHRGPTTKHSGVSVSFPEKERQEFPLGRDTHSKRANVCMVLGPWLVVDKWLLYLFTISTILEYFWLLFWKFWKHDTRLAILDFLNARPVLCSSTYYLQAPQGIYPAKI